MSNPLQTNDSSTIVGEPGLDVTRHGRPERELEALARITAALTETMDPGALLTAILEAAMEVVPAAEKGSILLLDGDTGELAIRTLVGYTDPRVQTSRFPHEEGYAAQAVREDRPLLIADARAESPIRYDGEIEEIRAIQSAAVAPLRFKGQVIGVISLDNATRKAAFNEEDLLILTILADQAAVAVSHARSYAAEQRRVREFSTLLEVAQAVSSALGLKQVLHLIALRTAQVCQVDRCTILLFDDEKKRLVPLMSQFASGRVDRKLWRTFREKTYVEPVDAVPAIREVIRQRKPVVLDDHTGLDALPRGWTEPFSIHSLLAVPLISRDQVIGMMTLDYTGEGQRFATWQVNLAVTIGSQLAVFIENARLYEEARERSRQVAAINAIVQALNASRDVRDVFQAVARELGHLIEFDRASIALLDEARQTFTVYVLADRPEAPLGEGVTMPLAATAAAGDVLAGQPHLTDDLSAELDYPVENLFYQAGFRSRVNVPLLLGEGLIGSLNLASTRPAAFSRRDLGLLQQVAGALAAALEKARLFEETEHLKAFNESIVQGVAEAILIEDAEGILTFANPAAEELLGYTREELIGRRWTTIVPEDERERVRQETARRPQGIESHYEAALLSKEGRVIPVIVSARPLFEDGKFVGVLTAFTDITERKRAEEEIHWRVETLAALHETALDLGSQRALPDLLQAIVARAVELLRAKGGGIYLYRPATDDLEFVLEYNLEPDFTRAVLERGEGLSGKVLETGQPLVVADYSRWEGRSPQYAGAGFTACVAVPICWGDCLLGVLDVLDDAPRAFSEADVALLERFTPLAAAALEQARLLEAEQTRRREAETLREAGAAVTSSLSLPATLSRILEQLNQVVPYDSATVQLLRDGDRLEIVGGRGWPDLSAVLGLTFDLNSPAHPNGQVIRTRQPVIVPDTHAQYPAFREPPHSHIHSWLGVPLVFRDAVIGMIAVDSVEIDHFTPEHARLAVAFARHAAVAIENARLHEEVRRQRDFAQSILTMANSLIVGLDLEGRVILFNDQCVRTTGWTREEALGRDWLTTFLPEHARQSVRRAWRDLLETGLPSQHTNPILTRSGEERVIAWSNTVLRDGEGRPISVIAIGQDITEQQRLEEQLRQAQKMEAIGTLAGGIAHDFNNILGGILGFASLVERELPADSPLRTDVATIISSARRGAELTNQLLAFARGGRYQVGPVDLNTMASEVVKLLSRTVNKSIQIEPRLAPDLAAVEGDAGQLHQMLLNLCLNARDAMPAGGRLTIETRNVTLGSEEVRGEVELTPGEYVCLSVTDTGVGMDPETQERIFEPFFTTKKGRRGEKHSGLGLAMVYGIVRGHRGAIHVHSDLGQGSTFQVYLPAIARSARLAAPVEVRVRGGTETVLVVDDEPDIRALLGRALGREGYTVLLAESGAEALSIYRERGAAIGLVVLDLIMPGMSGAETFRRLRELGPDVRVLLSSGYSEEGQAQDILAAGARGFLPKPYDFQAVLRKVREVLDAG